MEYASGLSILANWAAILTALIAVLAYGQFQWQRFARQKRLEAYLRRVQGEGQGQKTVLHLMRALRMTEQELLAAGFHSARITPRVKPAKDGLAETLLFEYAG